ncbi:hypothetical protein I4U23_007865 [Adineta vaga]|nr:hypothetical protein I4U23_007865 [Adineta vaga]
MKTNANKIEMDFINNSNELVEIVSNHQESPFDLEIKSESASNAKNVVTELAPTPPWNVRCICFIISSSMIRVILAIIFMCILMAIGIVIVCVTVPKPKSMPFSISCN